jgi:hypothetical protein
VRRVVRERFAIAHSTIQIETADGCGHSGCD